jgi:hypothetical protein
MISAHTRTHTHTHTHTNKHTVKIHYLGYGQDWDTWTRKADLRATQFPTLDTSGRLVGGAAVEVRLGQRGGEGYEYAYAWAQGTVLRAEDSGRVRVKIATQLGPRDDPARYFDEAIVNAGSIRLL